MLAGQQASAGANRPVRNELYSATIRASDRLSGVTRRQTQMFLERSKNIPQLGNGAHLYLANGQLEAALVKTEGMVGNRRSTQSVPVR